MTPAHFPCSWWPPATCPGVSGALAQVRLNSLLSSGLVSGTMRRFDLAFNTFEVISRYLLAHRASC